MNNKHKISRHALENIIERYFNNIEKRGLTHSAESMAKYIANKYSLSTDDVKKEYGQIIEAACDFDEKAYLSACDKKFFATDLKESFSEFCKAKWRRQMNEQCDLTLDDLYNDKNLSTFRKTTAYRNADQEGKYHLIWKILVSAYGNKICDEDELSDLCMEIAMHDENQF